MTNLSLKHRNRDWGEMWDSLNDFFTDNLHSSIRGDLHQFRTDIKDLGDHYLIEAEMPGFEKEDIKVDYDHGYLTISAKREASTKEEKDNYIRQERHYGEFERRFFVEDINENMIEAIFKNGVLTLNCLKLAISATERKRIEIH
ncbi:Hsp20/alpha crystallin family protein [Bacillus sp. 1NLA3E]|uniref:Hsp20/alpha crystallin family protein n=1 Tax=Bacillus sp. 1NLA3E TaxID=666686 RepID=UPI000247EB77|nr:Hsp20/alpha crystallin family protein [Bacillus sp. 1NLA3E]